jgi:tetratricopeptide (TPR) repeat protein
MTARALVLAILASVWTTSALAAESTADALLDQGAELFRRKEYEGAREAFAHAYALEPKAATLFNLALSELNSEHPVEAVAHLREYLTHADEPPAKLEAVRTKWLPRAEARTARLDVFAPAGAELLVDGVVQEHATVTPGPGGPPLTTIAIAAGDHDVAARQGTVSESQHVTARGGELVEVHFQRMPDAPMPASAIGWAGGGDAREHAEGAAPRGKWITVVALGSGAVVAAGLGVAFGVASRNEANEVQSLHNEIAPGSAWTNTQSPCAGASGSSRLCAQLKTALDANREDWTVSAASYVAAGVLGAASLATWMLWKPKSGAVVARPAVGAQSAGLVLSGQW